METALALPYPVTEAQPVPLESRANLSDKAQELMQKANERWWKMQVFLGKNLVTKMVAMEAVGLPVDVGLMSAGIGDPLYREPLAALVDLGVLHKLTDAHDKDTGHVESGRFAKTRKYGSMVLTLAAAIGAQKAGLALAEHIGANHELNSGVMLGSKYTTMLGINGANTLRARGR